MRRHPRPGNRGPATNGHGRQHDEIDFDRERGAHGGRHRKHLRGKGGECAYANLKLVTRVVSGVYDEALRPCGLRASQLALMWAILALEPVELRTPRHGHLHRPDDVEPHSRHALRAAGLVGIRAGEDRRVKIARLTATGRAGSAPRCRYGKRRSGGQAPSFRSIESVGLAVRSGSPIAPSPRLPDLRSLVCRRDRFLPV